MHALLTQHYHDKADTTGQETDSKDLRKATVKMLVSWNAGAVTPIIVESVSDDAFYLAFPKAKSPLSVMLKAPELQMFYHSQLTQALEEMSVHHLDVSVAVGSANELVFKNPTKASSHFVINGNDRYVVHSTEWMGESTVKLNLVLGETFAHHMINPIKLIESGALRSLGLDCYAWLFIKDGKLVLEEV
jgi:hypothetical protein